ncbi:hypothetical protein [Rhabdaerophilum sp. SD176]|uniref:hypothetical protein n=1 Tax=Rhabdaerophilum sp. SD176 TaxID=2983548 RepID=UPI0024DFDE1B|nr:hypothetical protein [Rhabdaerophilum sp. SD176]
MTNEEVPRGEAVPDPYENDPFFKRIFDSQWNACIEKQGEEENYIDGYIEAAIELVDAIFDKQLMGKRDTLVLPILYNARHAIELALKFATERLIEAGAIKDEGRKLSHDIKAYWDHLHNSEIGDEMLSETITALKPYVESLSQIDSDGQELRYHRNRENDPSLANYATANLRLIQASLRKLEKVLSALKYRTVDFADERKTGTFTNRCSRRDLLEVARLMPKRDSWGSQAFDDQKAAVKARYGLSDKQFSIALDRLQKMRQTRSMLGMESDLIHLIDDEIVFVVERWRTLHPKREPNNEVITLDYSDPSHFEKLREHAAKRQAVVELIELRLSPEALAELEAMFYGARDRVFVEYHDAMTERILKEHVVANDRQENIRHLIEKTNFLQCIQLGAARLGRLLLAERLKGM